jgi:hypothetical protein
MNKIYTLLALLILLAGCQKKHVYDVEVILKGDAAYRLVLNQPFVDPGAYGLDFMRKHIKAETDASELDINKTGTYKVKYSAVDEYGNIGTAERTVIVYNELEYLKGSWSFYKYPRGSGTPDTIYIETINVSDTLNRLFYFTRFSNTDNAPVQAHLAANLITIDSLQYQTGSGHDINIWFYGDGLQLNNNRLEISYSEIKNSITTLYTAHITRE